MPVSYDVPFCPKCSTKPASERLFLAQSENLWATRVRFTRECARVDRRRPSDERAPALFSRVCRNRELRGCPPPGSAGIASCGVARLPGLSESRLAGLAEPRNLRSWQITGRGNPATRDPGRSVHRGRPRSPRGRRRATRVRSRTRPRAGQPTGFRIEPSFFAMLGTQVW